ncbi:hypothetical protein Tco_1037402 [Tanacetum coccineum]
MGSFTGSSLVAMPFPLFSSLGGVEEYADEAFSSEAWTTRAVDLGGTCSVIGGVCLELVFLTQMDVPPEHLLFHHHSTVAPPELDQGFKVEHLPFHHYLVYAPPESD